MRSKVHSFSYLMELIIVIFFFAISTTICVSLIVKAKEKQEDAKVLQETLFSVQSMIETMQAHPNDNPTKLLSLEKVDEQTYQGENFVLKLYYEKTVHGIFEIQLDNQVCYELPFVLGGA